MRAGVLEHPSVELLRQLGLADRLDREGLAHRGIAAARSTVCATASTSSSCTGRSITVYGQQEVVKDLIAARLAAGGEIVFEALDVRPPTSTRAARRVRYRRDGVEHELRCRVVAGCDGSYGVCGPSVPDRATSPNTPTRSPGWASSPRPRRRRTSWSTRATSAASPCTACGHRRSPGCTCRWRPDEELAAWSDDRIWSRAAPPACRWLTASGSTPARSSTGASPPMHSSVSTPMRHGNLLIAGDAAHIVPATGAKGMNLAIADATVMAAVIDEALRGGRPERLAEYTPTCLGRVWRTQHFSHRMTTMLHRFDDDPFRRQLQRTELEIVTSSVAAATDLAEHYVGLPFATLAERVP